MRISLIKIKDLPKEIKDFLKYLELNEEKGINEPQPLGSRLKKIIDTRVDQLCQDPESELLTPLNQIIEVYEKFLTGKLDAKFKKDQQKFLHRKNFIDAIRYLFQVGADPELLYRDVPNWPKQNPLIRALRLRKHEKGTDDKIPTLFSTILKHSSFDVNESFFDYDGDDDYITPLSYMLGFNVNKEFEDIEAVKELLDHPDLEINNGKDLLLNNITNVGPDSELTEVLLDYGFNPNQTNTAKSAPQDLDEVKESQLNYGTLLNAYNVLIDLDSRINKETFRSLNQIFNSGRKLDLTLTDKDGNSLFKRCTHVSTGSPFLLELCITELKVQALQKWQSLQSQSVEIDQKKLMGALYSFFSQVLGKPSSKTKYDFSHLLAALVLDEKVISPVMDLKSSDSIERLSDTVITRVREKLKSTGYELEESINSDSKDKGPLKAEYKTDSQPETTEMSALNAQIIPIESAVRKGDKFIVQVVLMSNKARIHEANTGEGLNLAAKNANLNILHLLLTQIPISEPFKIFKYLLNNKHHYSNPGRQFAVIQLLLEHPIINDNISNSQLGKLFIDQIKDSKLSSILFKAIKKRILKVISSHTNKDTFRKFIADEFFAGNPNAIDDYYWGFLLRSFNTKPLLSKTENVEKPEKTTDSKFLSMDEGDFLQRITVTEADKKGFFEGYDSTIDKGAVSDKKSPNDYSIIEVLSDYLAGLDSARTKGTDSDKKSSPSSSVSEIVINKLVKFFSPNISIASNASNPVAHLIKQKLSKSLSELEKEFGYDFEFIKRILDKTFAELAKDISVFNESDRPLLENFFSALRAGPDNFQKTLEEIKKINTKRLSKFIAKIGHDNNPKTDYPQPFDDFEFAILFLKKVGNLDDQEKRLIAVMKFIMGSFYITEKQWYEDAIKHYKIAEEYLSQIQSPQAEDIEIHLLTLILIVNMVSRNKEIDKSKFGDFYLKTFDCFRYMTEFHQMPELFIHSYLDTIEKLNQFQLTPEMLSKIYSGFVALIFKIKDKPIITKLSKNQLELCRSILSMLVKNRHILPKEDLKSLVHCYMNPNLPESRKFDEMKDDEHLDVITQLIGISDIITQLSIDGEMKIQVMNKFIAHINALKDRKGQLDKHKLITAFKEGRLDEIRLALHKAIKHQMDNLDKLIGALKEEKIDEKSPAFHKKEHEISTQSVSKKRFITPEGYVQTPKFNWNPSFENALGEVFDSEKPKDLSDIVDNKTPLLFDESFFTKLEKFLSSKLAENKITFQASMLDSLISRLKKREEKHKLSLSEIAQQILSFKKRCKSSQATTVPTSEADTTVSEYQSITSAIAILYRDSNDAIRLLTDNFETIEKILASKYGAVFTKANIEKSNIQSDQQNLKNLKKELDDLLKKKDQESLKYQEILPSLKSLKEKFEHLKNSLVSKADTFNKVAKTYKDKVQNQSSTDESQDSTSEIKKKLEDAKKEREKKKDQKKNKSQQKTKEQTDKKLKWQKEQEQKRAEQKAAAEKKLASKATTTVSKSKDESKHKDSTSRATVNQKQQDFLSYALKNLLYIGFHYADYKLRHQKQKLESKTKDAKIEAAKIHDKAETILDDITHYALCYDMLRCFQALSIYKDFGGYTAAALSKEDIKFTRQAMIHSGLTEAEQKDIIESAELLYTDLTKDLVNRCNARQLHELQLEQDVIFKLVQAYKLTSDPYRFSLNSSIPLVVDDMPVYKHLHKYHSAKDVAYTSDDELLNIVWVKTVPIIKSIMSNVTKVFETEPKDKKDIDRFYELFLPHFQALKMLLTICGEYRTEMNCEQLIEEMRKLNVANEEMLNNSISFLTFLSRCRSIRNKVGHEFPEDGTIHEVFDAWRMLKSINDIPCLEITKFVTKHPKDSTKHSPKNSIVLSSTIWHESYSSSTEKFISMDEGPETTKGALPLDSLSTTKKQKSPTLKEKSEVKASDSRELFRKALSKSKNLEFVPRQPSSSTQIAKPTISAITSSVALFSDTHVRLPAPAKKSDQQKKI